MTTTIDRYQSWIALSVPHMREPAAWTGYGLRGEHGFATGVDAVLAMHGRMIYETGTAADLAQASIGDDWRDVIAAINDDDDMGFERLIRDTIAAHGEAVTLYRADYLMGDETYQVEPIDELEAYIAAAGHDDSGFWLVTTPAEAAELYTHLTGPDAPRVGKCGPLRAAAALRRAAIRLGWMTDTADADDDEDDDAAA